MVLVQYDELTDFQKWLFFYLIKYNYKLRKALLNENPRHYQDRLVKEIGEPIRCRICGIHAQLAQNKKL